MGRETRRGRRGGKKRRVRGPGMGGREVGWGDETVSLTPSKPCGQAWDMNTPRSAELRLFG